LLAEAVVVLTAAVMLPVLLAVRPAFDTAAALRTLAAAPRTLLAAGVAPGGVIPIEFKHPIETRVGRQGPQLKPNQIPA
jgi:hypothetical protein